MHKALLCAAARDMADLLNAMLDDVEAQTIALTRDEAVLIQGLIEGLANCLDLPPPG